MKWLGHASKGSWPAFLVAVLGLSSYAASTKTSSTASPVLKAVKLLEGLQVKVAEAEKLDQQTFAKYQGWCQKVSQTTQSDLTTNQQKQESLTSRPLPSIRDGARRCPRRLNQTSPRTSRSK